MRQRLQGVPTAIVACLLGIGLFAIPATASTFIALDLESLVTRSDAVVQGEVVQVDSFWDAEGRVIVTEARVVIEETITGESAKEITVKTFGGTVGDYTVEAVGFPRFAAGDRVVLFVNQRHGADDSIRVTGYQQGHYRIKAQQGVEMAVPTLDQGANLVVFKGQSAAAPEAQTLEQLKSEITRVAYRLSQPAN